jgi:hypothetical protein
MSETHDYRCSECGRRGHNARTCGQKREDLDGRPLAKVQRIDTTLAVSSSWMLTW